LKAIILAAGRGSRMGDLTSELPKCRTELHGKELIQWQIEGLCGAGITDIAIVRGYLAQTFTFDLHYFENQRWSETNMVMSLLAADDWLRSDTCIVSYSDIVYSSDAVSRLRRAHGDIVISYDPNWRDLWSARFSNPLSDAETFRLRNGLVTEIGNRAGTLDEIEGQFMGLIRYTPSGWCQIREFLNRMKAEQRDKLDMTSLLQQLIAAGISVHAIPIVDQWFEVDSAEDLAVYSEMEMKLH